MLLLFPSAWVCPAPYPQTLSNQQSSERATGQSQSCKCQPCHYQGLGSWGLAWPRAGASQLNRHSSRIWRKKKTRRACVFPNSRDREVSSNLLTLLTLLPHRVESYLVTCGSASQALKYCGQRHGDNGGTCFSS